MPWWGWALVGGLVGAMIGATLGVFVICLCLASAERDREQLGDDHAGHAHVVILARPRRDRDERRW